MKELYQRPLRVYILMGFLAIAGVLSGLNLPVSLFPNSSQPEIYVDINYGDYSIEEFQSSIGNNLEGQMKGSLVDGYRVEQITTEYRDRNVRFLVRFEWGADGQKGLRELQALTSSLAGSWPEEIRKSLNVNYWSENSGFLAVSFYSSKRSLDEIYEVLNPLLAPQLSSVKDSSDIGLWNPQSKSVEINLDPEKMASFQILPMDVEQSITLANFGYSGGALSVGEGNQLNIIFPKNLKSSQNLGEVAIRSRAGRTVKLKDIATIRVAVDKKNIQTFKTSGMASLILFAEPKPGGNIKRMADDVMDIIEKTKSSFPEDIEYKILVNPSQFINASIHGVIREVGLAALLAVLILFVFIGSLKNVITAAIEIPLSIIMAFIFMKLFNMNLNLISLGGLALSAGMNVDASVVVMENIFRHFDLVSKKLNFEERLNLTVKAVNEVKGPIISSTIASLVVFIPLIATKGLTNSILGDLAKAVVFSHSLSAIVALILVPTIRLQLMSREGQVHPKSLIEGGFKWLENVYVRALDFLLNQPILRNGLYLAIIASILSLSFYVIPRLPKEIIGRPETDWIILGVRPQNFTEHQQLVSLIEKIEFDVINKYQNEMLYTFTQLRGASDGMIMLRLKSRSLMKDVWKRLEEEYVNTPEIVFFVIPWNPSELKIPNPPHFSLEIRGGTALSRAQVTQDLKLLLQDNNVFPRVNQRPSFSGKEKALIIQPYLATLNEISKTSTGITVADIGNYLRIATDGKTIGTIGDQTKSYPIQLRLPEKRVTSIVDLKGLPIGINGKILSVSALAQIEQNEKPAPLYKIDQAPINLVQASENESNKANVKDATVKANTLFESWKKNSEGKLAQEQISVVNVDPNKELNQAIDQLKWALALSIALIFLTMILQFGDVVHSLLVLAAIPLGVIGVLLSLWIFKSTLSLNSVLGVILLNGIAVANSIILVDFMKKLVDQGMEPKQAALNSARARLRPILMTSLTTVLGMCPVALGLGEGGKILQPLGIAVSGGLWVSMSLTLFIVPALQVAYLNFKTKKNLKSFSAVVPWNGKEFDLQ